MLDLIVVNLMIMINNASEIAIDMIWEETTKYNGTQTCKLNENDTHALGNGLNYLIGRYNDSRNGNYARREIVGCYFIFSHTDLDNSEYSTEYMIRHIFNVDNAKDTFIPIWAEWA